MKIKTRDKLYNVLTNAGYSYHFTDCDGFILPLKNKTRFHIILEDDFTGEMHIDKTVNGKHKLVYCPSVMYVEKDRIKKYDLKIKFETKEKQEFQITKTGIKYLNAKIEYADNIKELIKTKVIKRAWYNPMRYIKGKFKYIKYD